MDFELRQRGRATIDFLADLAAWAGSKAPAINNELAARGLDPENLDADLDTRLDQVEAGMADSGPFFAWSQLGEWLSERHGDAAIAAFEEIRADLVPDLEQLQRGPATLDRQIGDDVPDYFRGVEFHRTRGGWDGHPYQGFIHGELIHKKYVAKNYPGDIFGQRRQILAELPRQDYRRMFEMGTSSGHFTIPLQETFPDAQLTGCDLSATMLEHAQRVANERGWAWRLLQVPAEDTGLPAREFRPGRVLHPAARVARRRHPRGVSRSLPVARAGRRHDHERRAPVPRHGPAHGVARLLPRGARRRATLARRGHHRPGGRGNRSRFHRRAQLRS